MDNDDDDHSPKKALGTHTQIRATRMEEKRKKKPPHTPSHPTAYFRGLFGSS